MIKFFIINRFKIFIKNFYYFSKKYQIQIQDKN